eukprot:gene7678-9446_t
MSSYNKHGQYLTREASVTHDLGEWIDEQEQKGKQPGIKTIGFEVGKSSTSPISIPSTSPSTTSSSGLLSKSPGGKSLDKTSPLSSSIKKQSFSSTGSVSPSDNSFKSNKSSGSTNSSTESFQPATSVTSPPATTSNVTSPISLSSEISPPTTSTTTTASNTPLSSSQPQQGQQQQQQQQQGQGKKQQQQQQGKKQQQQGQQGQQGGQKQQQQQGQGKKQQQQQGGQKQQQQKPQQQEQQSQSGTTSPQNSEESESTPATLNPQQQKSRGSSHAVIQYDDPKKRDKALKKKIINLTPSTHQVALFSHLPQYERNTISLGIGFTGIHPEIVSLGLKYADFSISGSTARAIAMMTAFKYIIRDFAAPIDKIYSRELDTHLKPQIQFLVDCRPLSISMGNSINYLKQQMSQTNTLTHEEAKELLFEKIDSFIERIGLAHKVITKYGVSKISDGDVILTYASSHVVELIIQQALLEGKRFRLIIVDSRPKHEGRELLHRLVLHGIKCTYILLNAVSYIMKEVTKVFVGGYSLLSNGSLISRAGTAMVASMAQFYNVPFIVCCETFKFSERVQLDSICFNQIGSPSDLVSNLGEKEGSESILSGWKDIEQLKILNLMYDLTPIELIDMVITEFGMVPPTSIPVILREYRKEITP